MQSWLTAVPEARWAASDQNKPPNAYCAFHHWCTFSMQILTVVHALHALFVFFKIMAPSLYNPSYRAHEMWSIVLLNSFNLAMACR